MKIARMIGLAVVAALASMAIAGVGSAAAASALCSAEPVAGVCEEGTKLEAATLVGNESEPGLFHAGGIEISCTESDFTSELSDVSGVQEGEVSSLVFNGCTDNVPFCNVQNPIESENLPTSLTWEQVGAPQGQVSLVNPTTSFVLAGIFCFGGPYTCTYANETTAKGDLSNPTSLAFEQEPVNADPENDEICPGSGELTQNYEVTASSRTLVGGTEIGEGNVWLAKE